MLPPNLRGQPLLATTLSHAAQGHDQQSTTITISLIIIYHPILQNLKRQYSPTNIQQMSLTWWNSRWTAHFSKCHIWMNKKSRSLTLLHGSYSNRESWDKTLTKVTYKGVSTQPSWVIRFIIIFNISIIMDCYNSVLRDSTARSCLY